jgi:hypothetical protein
MDENDLTIGQIIEVNKILHESAMKKSKKKKEITFNKTWMIGKYRINAEKCSKYEGWGRFGGGWQVEFGFQYSGSTLIINLFVMSIRIDKKRNKEVKSVNG